MDLTHFSVTIETAHFSVTIETGEGVSECVKHVKHSMKHRRHLNSGPLFRLLMLFALLSTALALPIPQSNKANGECKQLLKIQRDKLSGTTICVKKDRLNFKTATQSAIVFKVPIAENSRKWELVNSCAEEPNSKGCEFPVRNTLDSGFYYEIFPYDETAPNRSGTRLSPEDCNPDSRDEYCLRQKRCLYLVTKQWKFRTCKQKPKKNWWENQGVWGSRFTRSK
jgi:hypothetical protein